jgi:hypothetical protein
VVCDSGGFYDPIQLHALWQALYVFEQKHGRSPEVLSSEDAALLKAELPGSAPEIPEDWIKEFSSQVPLIANTFTFAFRRRNIYNQLLL